MPCAKNEKEKKGGGGAEFKVRPLSAVLNLSSQSACYFYFGRCKSFFQSFTRQV